MKNKNVTSIVGGAVFAVIALYTLVDMVRFGKYYDVLTWITMIAEFAAEAAAAAGCLTRKRKLSAGGFAMLTLLHFYSLFASRRTFYVELYGAFKFNLFATLPVVLCALAFLVGTVFLASKSQKNTGKFWYLPSVLYFAGRVSRRLLTWIFMELLGGYWNYAFTSSFEHGLFTVLNVIAMAGVMLTFGQTGNEEESPETAEDSRSEDGTGNAEGKEAGHVSLVNHTLLLLFTFGIWALIWVYRTTEFTNGLEGEEDRNPVTKLLLYIFIPFYGLYWVYKTCQRLDKMAAAKGIYSELASSAILLALFTGVVPFFLMQEKMNAIVSVKSKG